MGWIVPPFKTHIIELLSPVTQNVTLFGDNGDVISEVKMGLSWSRVGP